jgi:hypothetical protein
MAQRKVNKTEGHYLAGDAVTFDEELNFVVTANPEIDSQGGAFIHKIITNIANSWRLRDDVKGQDIIVVDTNNDVVTLKSPYKGINFDNIYRSTVLTTDATPTEIDKIDTLTDETMHLVEVKLSAKSDDNNSFATWVIALSIHVITGVATVNQVDVVSHFSGPTLSSGSVTFTANAGDVDIDVTGIAPGLGANITWNAQYEVIIKSTN